MSCISDGTGNSVSMAHASSVSALSTGMTVQGLSCNRIRRSRENDREYLVKRLLRVIFRVLQDFARFWMLQNTVHSGE